MARQVKIPVVSVLREALVFSLRRFPTVLRLCLASLIVAAVPILGLLYLIVPKLLSEIDIGASESAHEAIRTLILSPWFWLTLFVLLTTLLICAGMVLVSLTRLVVLEERPPLFSLNRFLGAFLSAWAVLTALTATLFLGVLATLVIPEAIFPEPGPMATLAYLPMVVPPILFVLVFYAIIRLEWFLIDAIVHGNVSLRRSWRLTRNNVWRLIGLSLLVALAGIAVSNIVQTFARPLTSLTGNLPLKDVASSSIVEAINLALDTLAGSPIALGAIVLAATLYCWLIGFSYAVPAFGYKALTRNDPPGR